MKDKEPAAVMRELSLNAPVAITMPAHVWVGFIATYSEASWNSPYANSILGQIVNALLDPEYSEAREAEERQEAQHDLAAVLARHVIGLRFGGARLTTQPANDDNGNGGKPAPGLYL